MEVDRADETEGCLPEPGDAEAGNPEQYHLPPQLGRVESRIENIRGRVVTRQWLIEVQDRTAPPVRRDGDIADPESFDALRAGIDHDRVLGATDTHDLERETRDDRLSIGYSESEPPHDAVGIRLGRDSSGALRNRAEIGLVLHQGFVVL